jgi:hypothetical protein
MTKAGFESDKANIVLFDFGTAKSSFLTNDFAEGARARKAVERSSQLTDWLQSF